MDEAVIKQIQREGADALLDIGVSVPLKAFHIPFRKSPLELRVTMRRPYMSGQILFARTYLSGPFSRRVLLRPVAWLIRNFMEQRYLVGAIKRFVSLMGTDPFIPIIRSAERTNPMSLRLSQRKKGS